MEEEKYYNGYFCSKCNIIPLIQIIPKTNIINILSLCKCQMQYENIDLFIKSYYKTNIPIEQISKESIKTPTQEIKKENILLIIDKFNKTKEDIDGHSKEIKEKLNDYIKNKDPNNISDK